MVSNFGFGIALMQKPTDLGPGRYDIDDGKAQGPCFTMGGKAKARPDHSPCSCILWPEFGILVIVICITGPSIHTIPDACVHVHA